jgi:DNA modification methylase
MFVKRAFISTVLLYPDLFSVRELMMETETVHRQASAQVTGRNKLNELSGRDWIKFTKTWFVHRPDPRGDRKIRHPASFPESLVREFVSFFTKKGEIVVDPFVGTGSTLVAALETGRSGIGFEIVKKYADISKERVGDALAQRRARTEAAESKSSWAKIITADSAKLSKIWKENAFPPADYCITSPPYWNQLRRSHMRQKGRAEKGLDTTYSDNPDEIGNIADYQDFLRALKRGFDEVYKVMKPKGYLTIITNNVFSDGRMYPLAFDTVSTLSKEPFAWTPKDEKVWCQDDKNLLPLGVFNAWVGNRHHQYCLIFRKEESPVERTSMNMLKKG